MHSLTRSAGGPLPPGSTIGILGGGQLARMLACSAACLGFRCVIFCPEDHQPALNVTHHHIIAPYDDRLALARFAQQCDVITYESENVPPESLVTLAAHKPIRPGIRALEITRDRLLEKCLLRDLSVPTTLFHAVDGKVSLLQAIQQVGLPAVLKTRRYGYDGKGQFIIQNDRQVDAAFASMNGQDAILERFVSCQKEVSVLLARGVDGRTVVYDLPENEHIGQILHRSRIPARISSTQTEKAISFGEKIARALDHVGFLAVEFFVLDNEENETLIVNEIAPRVHNSGHWTIDGCFASQFEQHIRAVAGWTLADPGRHSDVIMENLLGTDIERWKNISQLYRAALHIYDKSETRCGRKMGHVNYLKPRSGRNEI